MGLRRKLLDSDERLAIDRDSAVPLYQQVAERLTAWIAERGTPNTMIPPEEELGEMFGVSRITIRKAIESLVSKGLLARRRGIGTTILRTATVEHLGRLRSHAEEMRREGYEAVTKVLSLRTLVPRQDVRTALRLEHGEKALRVHRLRGTRSTFPIAVIESFFPQHLGLTEEDDFSRSSYDLLTKKLQIPVLWAQQTITARLPTAEEARLLKLTQRQPVLALMRTTYTLADEPIEVAAATFNPQHYSFSVPLSR